MLTVQAGPLRSKAARFDFVPQPYVGCMHFVCYEPMYRQ